MVEEGCSLEEPDPPLVKVTLFPATFGERFVKKREDFVDRMPAMPLCVRGSHLPVQVEDAWSLCIAQLGELVLPPKSPPPACAGTGMESTK